MRLWPTKLFPYLPRTQILSQKRECDLIWKDLANGKKTNHILINYIWEYENFEYELAMYYIKLNREFTNRGYEFNFSKNYKTRYLYNSKYIPFKKHHNLSYLRQCYFNLEEKFIRGQKDFDNETFYKLTKYYKNQINIFSKEEIENYKDRFKISSFKSYRIGINPGMVYMDEFIRNKGE